MAYYIYEKSRGQYEIVECKAGLGTFDTIEQAQRDIEKLIVRDAESSKRPTSDYQNALHGIPSEKSLDKVFDKLSAIKRTERMENEAG